MPDILSEALDRAVRAGHVRPAPEPGRIEVGLVQASDGLAMFVRTVGDRFFRFRKILDHRVHGLLLRR